MWSLVTPQSQCSSFGENLIPTIPRCHIFQIFLNIWLFTRWNSGWNDIILHSYKKVNRMWQQVSQLYQMRSSRGASCNDRTTGESMYVKGTASRVTRLSCIRIILLQIMPELEEYFVPTRYYLKFTYYYYYTIWMSLITGLFCLVLLLNQRWSPPLRFQVSHCSTFRITCDVPSIGVFCNISIECFPGTASKFFFRLIVTIPVTPIITGIIVDFRFHIRCISIHKLLYFIFFSASFCTTFLSAGIATSISALVSSFFLLLITISGLFTVTSLSVCTAWFHNTVTSPSSYTGLGMCVYHLSVVSMPKALHI